MPSLPQRTENIGTQDNAVVHGDGHIPIDLHAVANFAFGFCHEYNVSFVLYSKFCSIASRRNFGISARSPAPYPFATAADTDASVAEVSGIGTPCSAPVATADMMSFRSVRMSSVISGFSPFITTTLLRIQLLA